MHNRILQLCVLIALVFTHSCQKESKNTTLQGPIFGTGYKIIYNSQIDYTKQFDSLFAKINQSLSTYMDNSDISKLNRNESVSLDEHFDKVFKKSKEIYKETNGYFDPTIGDVVNAWKFGAENDKFLTDSTTIDSLMKFVGFDKVSLSGNKIDKPQNTYLEFNAIAKGYGVDVIADFLEDNGIQDYLVEIGGEMRVNGINTEKKQPWKVGLDEPRFDGEQSIFKAITLNDVGMATSGTYRKFKVDSLGNRYAHIIDTKTGYPAKTNILSVSVIAEDCMTADGYATAFQAMGLGRVEQFSEIHPEIKIFLIYEDENQEFQTLGLNGFPED
ncbi:MAG: FAD:protein FMN transferase [Bacteroidota bacterium]